jgi:hypothetical protein
LKLGDVTNFLAALNTARATKAGLNPTRRSGTAAARVDMLFRERGSGCTSPRTASETCAG